MSDEKPSVKRMPQDEAERHYIAGSRSAYLEMLHIALRGLGYDGTPAEHTKWISERVQTVAKLREMCADLGDNDWNDDLHLADVIDKHLWRYMETR